MTGNLFKNQKKETNKHPDYTGECKIEGVTYRMAAWVKDGKKDKYMSFQFSIPKNRGQVESQSVPNDNDYPF
jgi:hypothetical protein